MVTIVLCRYTVNVSACDLGNHNHLFESHRGSGDKFTIASIVHVTLA